MMSNVHKYAWIGIVLLCLSVLPLETAYASAASTCTSDSSLAYDESKAPMIISEIAMFIVNEVHDASRDLFNSIRTSSMYEYSLIAAFTLFVMIYGILILFGLSQLTLAEGAKRIFKFGIVMAFISPSAWSTFNDTVVQFFNAGSDELIAKVIEIGMAGMTPPSLAVVPTGPSGQPSPFWVLDLTFGRLLSPDSIIGMMSMFTTGVFGLGAGLIMVLGAGGLIFAMLDALRIYAVAVIAKALLFGMAPIFFAFLLFERTKPIFTQGYIPQLVHFSLLPVLLFTFLSFYIQLLDHALEEIVGLELCWVPVQAASGDQKVSMWRFVQVDDDGKKTTIDPTTDWNFDGAVSCLRSGTSDCPEFPVNIVDLLIFFILAHLAMKFNGVVEKISSEISGTTMFLNKQNLRDTVGGLNLMGGGRR